MCFPKLDGNMSLPHPRSPQRHISRVWLSETGTSWCERRCRAIPDGDASSSIVPTANWLTTSESESLTLEKRWSSHSDVTVADEENG